jgi:hypothetical protein
MQLPFFALLFATLATLSLAATNEQICRDKSSRTGSLAAQAIRNYCSKTDLVANSLYAMQGKYAGPNIVGTHAFVAAKSSCPSSSNWIPQQYCLAQFYETRAKGDRSGHGRRSYGVGNCQEFNLQAR